MLDTSSHRVADLCETGGANSEYRKGPIQYIKLIYARKSHEDKKHTEKSIRDQVNEWKDRAQQDGLFIARTIEESKSAMKPHQRPYFTEMLQLIRDKEIDGILCWHINRLVRNMEEGGLLAQMLVDGVIKEIRTHSAIYRSGDNILPLVMEAASSTQFSLDLRDSVTRGMNSHVASMGGWNSKAYQGYRNTRHKDFPKVGVVVPDEERFPLIRKAWDLMLTGAYTPAQVFRVLNKEWGYRTRKTEKSGGGPISRDCVYRIFSNPFYAGFVRYKGKLYRGTHQPMVTEAEFAQVQEYLQRNTKQCAHHLYFSYSGVMLCGYCRLQATAEQHSKKGQTYISYHCNNGRGNCTKKGLSEQAVEAQYLNQLKDVWIYPELCDLAYSEVLRSIEHKAGDHDTVSSQQQKTLHEIDRELTNLAKMWMKEIMTDEKRYRMVEKELEDEREKLLEETAKSEGEVQKMKSNARNCCNFLKLAPHEFELADKARKREIVSALATEHRLYGIEKKLVIQVHPLLIGMVSFAKSIGEQLALPDARPIAGSFELIHKSSQSQQNASFQLLVFGGRAPETAIEPPESLLAALRDLDFPDLFAHSNREEWT